MNSDWISGVLLPIALAFIMFSLGLGLTSADFMRILRQPRALFVGALCHFVVLPCACYLMLKLWGVPGVFSVGFMILAACPTGTTSNLLTYIARGDVALALSFTAIASVATIFTLPLIVTFSLQHFLGAEQTVKAPVGFLMGQTFVMLGLPVALGMALRHFFGGLAQRVETKATHLATILFVLIVLASIARNWALLREHFATLAPFAMLLNLTMLGVGFAAAYFARLPKQQSITLGIETAVQNATLALVIASSILQQDAMAVPGALYGVLMYCGGLIFAFLMRNTVGQSINQSLTKQDLRGV